jgi:integrase
MLQLKKRLSTMNACSAVEFPVRVRATTRKPHYMTSGEQERILFFAPRYLKNAGIILVEMGLRPYKELMPIEKRQIDLENRIAHVADSKTPNGVADMPTTDLAYEAFRNQVEDTPGSDYLFPTTKRSSKPYIGSLKKIWASTLKRAQVRYFSLYELRHTFATRLSAGGVADEWVTQLLRQGDARVFKKYSPMKLEIMREALNRLNRRANEGPRASYIPAPS